MSSTGKASAEGYDANIDREPGPAPVEDYLTARVAEIEYGIKSAEKVAAGAKATAAQLREDLYQAKADLKAHRAGMGN